MCNCNNCKQIDELRRKTILECQCSCHTMDGIQGHETLCCAYPNGKKKDCLTSICPTCGFEKEVTDNLNGQQCPKCLDVYRFNETLQKEYCSCEDDSIPIKLICSKCGKEWSSDAEPTRTTTG